MQTEFQTDQGARSGSLLTAAWIAAIAAAVGVRLWNAFNVPLMSGYDAPGHLAYVFYLDRYQSIPWAHQGWGYFHPPLHYAFGWALAQLGSAELLLRGLALLGSAASVGIAALAAFVARTAAPQQPVVPLLAFTAVAFLPVHLYTSPMSGNELTCALLGCAAIAALVANEVRRQPRLAVDAGIGVLLGLALLSKFSGAVYLAAALVTLALRPLRVGRDRTEWRRAALRTAAVAAVALALAGPYYARNVSEYGTPFRMNRDYPLTARVEARQAPGSRTWRDFVNLSPRLVIDPSPGAAHLVHSIWGTAFVNTWVDTRSLWNRLPEDEAARLRRARTSMLLLGLPPTLLAIAGALLAIRDVRRGRRSGAYVPLLACAALALLAFAIFAVRVPRISALKASYLMGLSLPYGVFIARSVEALGRRAYWGMAAVGLSAAAAAVVFSIGGLHPRRAHDASLGAVHYLIGEYPAARAVYESRLAQAPDRARWLDALAAVELADGDPERARALTTRAIARSPGDARRRARLGAAAALSGDLTRARASLGEAAANGAGAPAYSNLGAVLAAEGNLAGAEVELRRATAEAADLAPAWHNLAVVLERAGRAGEADEARREWRRTAHAAPRDTPYDVGVGLLNPGELPLLWIGANGLELARAPFRGAP